VTWRRTGRSDGIRRARNVCLLTLTNVKGYCPAGCLPEVDSHCKTAMANYFMKLGAMGRVAAGRAAVLPSPVTVSSKFSIACCGVEGVIHNNWDLPSELRLSGKEPEKKNNHVSGSSGRTTCSDVPQRNLTRHSAVRNVARPTYLHS
jgi:hypothetical protein